MSDGRFGPGLGTTVKLIVKPARPGFWATAVWFYLLPLGRHGVFGDWRLWLGLMTEAGLVACAAHDRALAVFLLAGALFFAADAALLWREHPYAPWQMRALFLGWNAVALLSIPWMWWQAAFATRS